MYTVWLQLSVRRPARRLWCFCSMIRATNCRQRQLGLNAETEQAGPGACHELGYDRPVRRNRPQANSARRGIVSPRGSPSGRRQRGFCPGFPAKGLRTRAKAGSMVSAAHQRSVTMAPTRSSNHLLTCKIRSHSTPVCSHTQPRCVTLEPGLDGGHNAASS